VQKLTAFFVPLSTVGPILQGGEVFQRAHILPVSVELWWAYTITRGRTYKWTFRRVFEDSDMATVSKKSERALTETIMPELEDVPDSEQTGGPPENASSFAMNGTSDTIRNRHAAERNIENNTPILQHRANDCQFLNIETTRPASSRLRG
jgi:hypothetical protein